MVFLSGFAGLVYQVLWMRQLGLLFGNTAYAAAATLATFFAGLAAGSWFWGRRVTASSNPWRVYAGLEIGIAAAALLYFGVLSLFYLIYPPLYQSVEASSVLFFIKCVLALILVFPPAFFMGGTIPVIGQCLIFRRATFGTTTARIYGINLTGAATGAFSAAFLAIPQLGFNMTCIGAMVISSGVAALAFRQSRGYRGRENAVFAESDSPADETATRNAKKRRKKDSRRPKSEAQQPAPVGIGRRTVFFLAFLSGFSVLALEVVWTRMFAQVHENSVYSFAAVLIIVLVCLSLGALLAAALARAKISAGQCLPLLLVACGVTLSLSPWLFVKLTGNVTMLATSGTFLEYVTKLFTVGFMAVGPACVLLGMVFPYLMKSEEAYTTHPGRSIGYLSAMNTVGAILGPLLCGFLLLRFLGLWWTVHAIAALYLLTAMVLPTASFTGGMILKGIGVVCLVLLVTVLNPSGLPLIGRDPNRARQTVLEVWETSDCSVAVVEDEFGHRAIKVNSNYILGSTDAIGHQIFQARVPLFAYPATEDVFFLGMGTGITAGGALDTDLFPSVKRIVACELVPEVVTAAKRYMAGGRGGEDYTNGLFTDPRAEILIADGRHHLMATDDKFDMINADLFLTYRSGAGSLYSREHFENIMARLNPDGCFVQWVPLYQVTEFEFGTISRTMLEVFDQVTLWRNNFQPGAEIVALVGHKGNPKLSASELQMDRAKIASVYGKNWRHVPDLLLPCNEKTIPLFYCGNMAASKELFDDYPINTDDRPVIEYVAPRSLHKDRGPGKMPPTFVGPRFADLVDQLLANCPPAQDPVLANRSAENRRLPLAGAALHRAWIGFALEDPETCRQEWEVFVNEWTNRGE